MEVLFTVTPTDQEEALGKIKEALDLYLELPASPISDTVNESIAVQRLESTVLRLSVSITRRRRLPLTANLTSRSRARL